MFALSSPLWLLGALTRRQLTADLPVSSFVWVCPVVAAVLLVHREAGPAGVAGLLGRAVDWRRIRRPCWLAAVLLLPPGIYALTYALLWLGGRPLPAVRFPVLAAAGQLVAYLVAAEGEELGWTGYALEPLQERWSALSAGLLLGVVWAGFHLVPLVQHGRPAACSPGADEPTPAGSHASMWGCCWPSCPTPT